MPTETMRATTARFESLLAAIAPSERRIAIAYSGGLDSSVLLHLAHGYAKAHAIELHAFHVHHGLSDQADAWASHCALQASALGIEFDSRCIVVDNAAGDGIESAARKGRYAALGALCVAHGVPLLLTAHHQDDQAETVLLQLLRGSGVAGLSGMDAANHAPELLGDAELRMGRPLLQFSRAALEEIAVDNALAYVQDPSNNDPRFARNALRTRVMPVLEAEFPGFARRFARTAQHAQAAQQLLVDLAAQDWQRCAVADDIDIGRLRLLSMARIDNLLRYWFGRHNMRMPSSAWLREMREQLFGAKHDAQILIGHADCDIHRYRDRIVMTPRRPLPDPDESPTDFAWKGEDSLHFPAYRGCLRFVAAEQGVDARWLREQTLALQWRGEGGWRLKLAANRPTRNLKYHYQAANVPAWERVRLPLVTVGRQLLYAAGLGMDCHHFAEGEGERISLEWHADPD